jgi:hypothetical protein
MSITLFNDEESQLKSPNKLNAKLKNIPIILILEITIYAVGILVFQCISANHSKFITIN